MRGEDSSKKSGGMFRTLATGLILSLLVMAAAMIYMLYNYAPASNRASVMLPFAIPFGSVAVILAGVSLYAMGNLEKLKYRLLMLILSFLAFAEEVAVGVLGIALFNNVTIGVCLLFIAACLVGLSVVSFLGLKEGLSE